jgi:hypothetical protein
MVRNAHPWGIFTVLTFVVVLISSATLAHAQQPATLGSVCVSIFDDQNRSTFHEAGEAALADVNVNLVVNQNVVIANYVTDGSEPYCFSDLPAQDYTVSASSPFYQLTGLNAYTFTLGAGERKIQEFGAISSAATPDVVATPTGLRLNTTPQVRVGLALAGSVVAMLLMTGLGLIIRWGILHKH